MRESFGAQTKVIHSSRSLGTTRAMSAPIWQTTSFEAESPEAFSEAARAVRPATYYTRYGNPTRRHWPRSKAAQRPWSPVQAWVRSSLR